MTRFASRIPSFAMVCNLHAVRIRSHELLEGTCPVFPVFFGLVANGQRERCSVQHEANLGTFEAARHERIRTKVQAGIYTRFLAGELLPHHFCSERRLV